MSSFCSGQDLWKYGCPEKFTTMIESLHTGMMVNVRNGGEVYHIFSITNGVQVFQCVIKVRPEDQHTKDRSDVPTELYNDHGGGH